MEKVNVKTVRLTPRQRRLLERCERDGGLRIALRDSKSRRAAERLRGLGLIEWSGQVHAWVVTGKAEIRKTESGKRPEREAAYSDYCRAN